MFHDQLRKFLNKMFSPREKLIGPSKKIMYQKIPYINEKWNMNFKEEVRKIFKTFYPQIDLRLVFYNSHKIRSYLSHKDKLDQQLCSSIVYNYECDNCSLSYIGSSTRSLRVRLDEHRGVSTRSDQRLAKPAHSNIRTHAFNCGSRIEVTNFKILFKAENLTELRIAESMYIKLKKPELNGDISAVPLSLF